MIKGMLQIVILTVTMLLYSPLPIFAQPPHLTLAATPWEYLMGEELDNGGHHTEMVTTIMARAGYSVDIKWAPLKRAVEMTKTGYYDGAMTIVKTPEDSAFFDYSEPIEYIDFHFFVLDQKGATFHSAAELAPATIGTIRGGPFGVRLTNIAGIETEEVNDASQNIRKLLARRIDSFITSSLAFQAILKQNPIEDTNRITRLDPAYERVAIRLALSRKHPDHEQIIANFNRSLKSLKEDGTLANIVRKHGFNTTLIHREAPNSEDSP